MTLYDYYNWIAREYCGCKLRSMTNSKSSVNLLLNSFFIVSAESPSIYFGAEIKVFIIIRFLKSYDQHGPISFNVST